MCERFLYARFRPLTHRKGQLLNYILTFDMMCWLCLKINCERSEVSVSERAEQALPD